MRIVLHQPEIAGNLGNILRTCACFGLPLSIIEPLGFPLAAKDVRRAAMDYGRAVELTRHASWDAYRMASSARRILFTTKGAERLDRFAFRPGDHIVFGSESGGAPGAVHAACDARVAIPLSTGARSLNLSNAVALAAWEALRQTAGLPKASP